MNKEYVLLYGDPEVFLAEVGCHASSLVAVHPLIGYLKEKYNLKGTTLMELFAERGEPVMMLLAGYYSSEDELLKAINQDTDNLVTALDLDRDDGEDQFGLFVFAIQDELVTVKPTIPNMVSVIRAKEMHFLTEWVPGEAEVIVRGGGKKVVSHGHRGMLDTRYFSLVQLMKGVPYGPPASKGDGDPWQVDHLRQASFLNWSNTEILNSEILDTNPNAPFTIFVRRDQEPVKAPVPKLTVV